VVRAAGNIIRAATPMRIVTALVILCLTSTAALAGPRLDLIRKRGYLICGVEPAVAGFVDPQGRYRGFDVDVCRAVAAAIF
jgi:general L-amino acid transport system substrate-binding protein